MAEANSAASEVDRISRSSEGDVVREAVALTKRIKELQGELAPLTDKLSSLQPKLLDHFERSGDQRRTVDGMTAYLRRDVFATLEEGVERSTAAEVLIRAGLDDYVKRDFNIQSVSAYVRELEREHDWEETGALLDGAVHPLLVQHSELEGVLKPVEKFSVRIISAR